MSIVMSMSILVGIASLAGFYRLFKGPTLTDRVIGLDLLFAIAIFFCLVAAWYTQRTVYVDVAIVLGLTGFITTLTWTRLALLNQQTREDV